MASTSCTGSPCGPACPVSVKGHPKFPTCGHRKLPTPWFLRQGLGRLNQAGLQLLLETVGVAPDVHSDRMMEQAIQDRRGDHPVAEDLTPTPEALIAGEDHRAALVATTDQLEEEVGPGPLDGQIADFVDD